MAVNCAVVAVAMVGVAGVTAIDTNVAAVTVRVVPPEIDPLAAEIVELPGEAEVARPCEPLALLIVATAVLEEDQVTCVVRFWVELSV